MNNKNEKSKVPRKFSNINTSEELKLYLDDMTNRLKNGPYLYHYTTISNVVKMMEKLGILETQQE